ncbi:hypothetical protein MKOR_17490 [Mycolicibacillus koreensis]|nr:hypothetical protein MKOR_17490 [Mycolicibacillus koreensis]
MQNARLRAEMSCRAVAPRYREGAVTRFTRRRKVARGDDYTALETAPETAPERSPQVFIRS